MEKLKKELGIFILNYNGQKYLKSCLDSLKTQKYNHFDIYLVDNQSIDNSVLFVKNNYPEVIILQTNGNLGYSGGYNYMLNHLNKNKICYKYLLLLNNDTICDESLIQNVCNFFDKHKNVGIICPTILNIDNTVFSKGGTFIPFSGTSISKGMSVFKRENKFIESFWGSGCALFIRQELFVSLDGFADYFMYFEDIDLSWRVRNLGYKVVYLANTFVVHVLGGAKAPSSLEIYYSERNRIISYWRNLNNIILLFLFPMLVISRLLLLFYYIRSFDELFIKFKGLVDGIRIVPKYDKIKSPVVQQLSILVSAPRNKEYSI